MSDNSLTKGNTLYKAGISQEERQLTALLASLPVDSRTRKEIYEFFREYAQEISYYNLQNEKEGVWDHFIPGLSATSQEVVPFDNIVTYWKKLGLSENELQRPHVSLILVFIELFELLKGQLNQLSKQHLDYYYKRVLQIDHRTFQPDQVYIQFKIQESLHDYLLPKGTQLSAGVDALGNPLAYALDEDVLLNQASIREIYTLLVDHSGGELIYTSSIQNTAKEDTKPIKDGAFWPPFGEPQYNKSGTEKTMTLSNVGWCIASHSLYMQEGERVVTSTLDFGAAALDNIFDYLTSPAETKIRNAKTSLAQGTTVVEEPLNNALTNVELLDFPIAISELSTALYEAKSLSLSSATVDAITGAITEVEKVKDHLKTRFKVFFSGETAWIPATIINVTKIIDGHDKLQFTVRLENTQPAVTAYHKTLDVDYPLSTGQPCMKVILKQTSDHNIYTKLKNLTLNRVLLDVTVTGMTQLHLFNDSWEIDHEKPFYPFETYPEIGSHFYIGCKELFQKSTDTVTLNMNWQQVPEILRDHYKDYYGVLVLPAHKKIREAVVLLKHKTKITKSIATSLKDAATALVELNLTATSSILQTALDEVLNLTELSEKTAIKDAITAAKTEVESVASTLSLIANDSFKAEVHILDQGRWTSTKTNTAIPLFHTTDARTTNTVNFSFPDGLTGLTSAQKKELDTSNFTLNSRNGFLRLTLNDPTFIEGQQPFSAFGYEKYPEIFSTITENNNTILSERIIAENKQNVVEAHNQTLLEDATKLDIPFIGPEIPPIPLPKEPYEPILKQFSLSYTAQETISLSAGSASESKCYQIHPFGHKLLDQPAPPLPQYTLNDDSNANGNLYIGFENLQSKQSVSLLIKMTDGYVNTTHTTDKKIIEWCYLKENNWIPFGEKQLLHDGTDGFKHSGLVNIALPDDAQDGNHHLMPSGLKWIQIKTNRNTEEIEKIMSITTQAGSATFLNQENDLSHLAASLPAASITELVDENANIDQIIQPYPSFGGRGSESESSYYTRVSERLRHKNRAITPWDYERLVLEQFPQIHRVKCIRNTNQHGELRAGYLTLVVIPKTIQYQTGNRYQPKASRTDLLSIQEYISSKASPHTTIEVANPSYETLTIDCEVGFIDQLSVGQYKKQLDEDLKKLFSPWAYDDQNSITFSDVMYRSQILLYIENRPYINYVSQLKITQTGKQVTSKGISHMRIVASRTDEYDFTIAGSYIFTDQSIIRVQSERSIFVTAAEHTIKEHRINIPPAVLDGINYWALETDFTVF